MFIDFKIKPTRFDKYFKSTPQTLISNLYTPVYSKQAMIW